MGEPSKKPSNSGQAVQKDGNKDDHADWVDPTVVLVDGRVARLGGSQTGAFNAAPPFSFDYAASPVPTQSASVPLSTKARASSTGATRDGHSRSS